MDWFTTDTVTPRKAAAGILLRGEGDPQVLLARRNTKLRFFGGHHVFPGGSIDKTDEPALLEGSVEPAKASAVVAMVREVFEEAGLLLSRGPCIDIAALRQARQDLHDESRTFGQILADLNHTIIAQDFQFAVNWITPPYSPVRFDTDFFLCHYRGPYTEEVYEADGEIVALEWLRPQEARRRWHADGSIRLSTPVALTLRYLAAFPPELAFKRMVENPGRDMGVPNRFEPRPGITIIPTQSQTLPPATHTNCVAIGDGELLILDPGAGDEEEVEHLIAHLQRLTELGGRVHAILLSHGHGDHAAAAAALRERFDAPIWAHAAAKAPCSVDRFLEDEEVLSIQGDPPWKLRCIYSPGHTRGHCCFLEETTKTLFCGDMLANPGTIMIDPDSGGDMDAYLKSLERLLSLDFELTVPGHGLPTWQGSGKEEIRNLIQHRLEREARIQQALSTGADSLTDLLEAAYDDVPQHLWPFAERQLKAHLIRLGHPL